jgi:hypothetical protein
VQPQIASEPNNAAHLVRSFGKSDIPHVMLPLVAAAPGQPFTSFTLLPTERTGPSREKDPSASAGDAVRSRGATLTGKKTGLWLLHLSFSGITAHLASYFCSMFASKLRAQRKPVPCVCSANPPRPRADAVMSANGLCHDPPRIDRTTPLLSGPWGFLEGACW